MLFGGTLVGLQQGVIMNPLFEDDSDIGTQGGANQSQITPVDVEVDGEPAVLINGSLGGHSFVIEPSVKVIKKKNLKGRTVSFSPETRDNELTARKYKKETIDSGSSKIARMVKNKKAKKLSETIEKAAMEDVDVEMMLRDDDDDTEVVTVINNDNVTIVSVGNHGNMTSSEEEGRRVSLTDDEKVEKYKWQNVNGVLANETHNDNINHLNNDNTESVENIVNSYNGDNENNSNHGNSIHGNGHIRNGSIAVMADTISVLPEHPTHLVPEITRIPSMQDNVSYKRFLFSGNIYSENTSTMFPCMNQIYVTVF